MEESTIKATWEEYVPEIREFVLQDGTAADWERIGVNDQLREIYDELQPYLEAHRTLATARGYKAATFDRWKKTKDPFEKSFLLEHLATLEKEVKALEAKVIEPMKEHQPKIDELTVVRTIRDSLGDSSSEAPEPP